MARVFKEVVTVMTGDVADRYLISSLAVRDGMLEGSCSKVLNIWQPGSIQENDLISPEQYKVLRNEVQKYVQQNFSIDELDPVQSRNPVTRNKFNTLASNKILEMIRQGFICLEEPQMAVISARLFSDILGYGPLERHFNDPEITEIKVNNLEIRIEKHGLESIAEERFESTEQGVDLIRRMIIKSGKRIDQAEPRVNARLHDGSRMMAQISPVAVDELLITIRRFRQDITRSMLVSNKSVSHEVMSFLEAAVCLRSNMIIAGGTSSGKTTWLNVLAGYIDPALSIVTIEDPAELQLQHPDVRRLEARDANIEGKGRYTLSDGVKDALRMAPDIIILGEARREEALDMLQAMNTGHEGSLGTIHANSARHSIARLAYMVSMAEVGLPYEAIIDQIADAIDFIIYVRQDRSGRRRLDHIVEVTGTEVVHGKLEVQLNPLWNYDKRADSWIWTGRKFSRSELFREVRGWHAV